jgi:hypothetical protein
VRQVETELALAAARGISVHHIRLRGPQPIPIWDFKQTEALIFQGYETMVRAIRDQHLIRKDTWFDQLPRWWRMFIQG